MGFSRTLPSEGLHYGLLSVHGGEVRRCLEVSLEIGGIQEVQHRIDHEVEARNTLEEEIVQSDQTFNIAKYKEVRDQAQAN